MGLGVLNDSNIGARENYKVNIPSRAGTIRRPLGVVSKVTDSYDCWNGCSTDAGTRMAYKSEGLMKKDAEWALQELEKYLPLNSQFCDCSADLVYYITQIRKELRRKK